jgi:acetyl esterase
MPLDAELQPIVDLVNAIDMPAPDVAEVVALRESFALMAAAGGTGPDEVEVEGLGVPGGATPIALRVYRPGGAAAATTGPSGRTGALLFFHGGGWVIGDLDTHDATCRELCARSGVTIISVGYRLAPEHVFPAAHDDCWRALRWVADHAVELEIDPGRLAVGGDSAGGHLATATALRARDEDGPAIALQVLVYPVTDLRGDDSAYRSDYPSKVDNAEGYVLTTDTMAFFRDTYVPDAARRGDASASPIAAGSLAGLPPAFVLTAEFDPLRDEGEAYAARLAEDGVPTTAVRYDGAIHMFFQLADTAIGSRALDQVAAELRERLG